MNKQQVIKRFLDTSAQRRGIEPNALYHEYANSADDHLYTEAEGYYQGYSDALKEHGLQTSNC